MEEGPCGKNANQCDLSFQRWDHGEDGYLEQAGTKEELPPAMPPKEGGTEDQYPGLSITLLIEFFKSASPWLKLQSWETRAHLQFPAAQRTK